MAGSGHGTFALRSAPIRDESSGNRRLESISPRGSGASASCKGRAKGRRKFMMKAFRARRWRNVLPWPGVSAKRAIRFGTACRMRRYGPIARRHAWATALFPAAPIPVRRAFHRRRRRDASRMHGRRRHGPLAVLLMASAGFIAHQAHAAESLLPVPPPPDADPRIVHPGASGSSTIPGCRGPGTSRAQAATCSPRAGTTGRSSRSGSMESKGRSTPPRSSTPGSTRPVLGRPGGNARKPDRRANPEPDRNGQHVARGHRRPVRRPGVRPAVRRALSPRRGRRNDHPATP